MTRKNKILGVLLLSAVPALAHASPSPEPPPDSLAKPELIELRSQLFDAGKEKALAKMSMFRPLCDADGYPLVGNAGNKNQMYQPSQFCAEVRKANK